MADLKALRKTKTNAKRSISKHLAYFENIKLDEVTVYDINVRLDKVAKSEEEFLQALSGIEAIDEKTDYGNERDEIEDKICKAIALGKKLRDDISVDKNKIKNADSNSNNFQAASAIRLPELSLPKFNGEYECWYTFKDTFKALIHNNTSLSDVQKYYYLNSCLKGPAAKLLSSLEINANNYSVAWDLLQNRFENEKLIVNSHIDALLDLPVLTKENYNSLRNLVDEFSKHKAALEMLRQPIKSWDSVLVRILTRKLDPVTRKSWEGSQHMTKLPTLMEILDFLNNRCRVLETMNVKNVSAEKTRAITTLSISNNKKCVMCTGEHLIYACPTFIKLKVDERKNKARELGLCLNCLRKNHVAKDCRGYKCNKCNRLHNRLLHMSKFDAGESTKKQEPANSAEVVSSHCRSTSTHVLLSTALVKVNAINDTCVTMRALLDVGSDSNFITKKAYRKLGLNNTREANIKINGICLGASETNLQTTLKFRSCNSDFKAELTFLLVDAITSKIPLVKLDKSSINIPKHIQLADPEFNLPDEIDLLIGAEIFYDLIKGDSIKLGNKKPVLRNTQLGWLVTGTLESELNRENRVCQLSVNQNNVELQTQLEKFWETEEVQIKRHQSVSELECEKDFVNNFTRTEDGRFNVCLPVKDNASLGDSKEIAINRFKSLERRLGKNPEIKNQYIEFMNEYLNLDHMELLTQDEAIGSRDSNKLIYYIPHHHVMKDSSSTTKLRVVFNASAKTTNDKSLNDILHVGPFIQSELLDILLRFRLHNVVITGDIEKMYRQIWINDKHRDLQRILWRRESTDPLLEYKLKTITYGTAPASFLATRVLKQLAIENKEKFPESSISIEQDFYMDDWIAGGESEEVVIKLKDEVTTILKSAGLNLRKFGSNSQTMLNNCSVEKNDKHILRNMTEERTLGIQWDANADSLKYELMIKHNKENTKRAVLSLIARIFDPLGLISPITIRSKIFLQKLWLAKLNWDENLPIDLLSEWNNICTDLVNLNSFMIARHVLLRDYSILEIHGFSDASEKAYGCAIYIKTVNECEEVAVSLFCSKSKVAPVKNMTLPRLELCGAVVLVSLMKRVLEITNLNYDSIHYWTDSSIVLNWIHTEPCKLKTFVANRISKIQTYTKADQWHHVKGNENPADIVSRGATVSELTNSIWLNGPDWLSTNDSDYKIFKINMKNDSNFEFKICKVSVNEKLEKTPDFSIFERFPKFNKLVRIVAWCKRFAYNCGNKQKRVGFLSNVETNDALECIIRIVQYESFELEIACLQKSRTLNSSKLLRLNCYLDDKNVIRVGGRLDKADIAHDRKHPIILPRNHIVTKLIIEHEHERLFHAGPQLTLSSLRQKYWPIGGRDLVRKIIRRCIICFKARPTACTPIMGNLPIDRVNQVRSLSVVGIDFCGPFQMKNSHLRNRILIKSYVCVFVCFATRAVHLELATSLTTENFLNVLKRFIGRRGVPSKIVSDNGTNFVGSANEIKQIKHDLSELNQDEHFWSYVVENNIDWQFNPARSPHFGGLHEAAVKSAKSHLKKIVSTENLTYEGFLTVLCQIEGILNSRPLIPLTEDPEDLHALTPGHFLINQPLTALPDRSYTNIPACRLNIYKRQQQIVQNFWKRWQRDYLHILQERSKWQRSDNNVTVGCLVLLKEENVPPQHWHLARVVEIHPGDDGVVRVVTVQTSKSRSQRAVRKICPLPIGED